MTAKVVIYQVNIRKEVRKYKKSWQKVSQKMKYSLYLADRKAKKENIT